MRWLAIVAVASGLGGCGDAGRGSKDEAFNGCRFEVMKMFPGQSVEMYSGAPMEVREAMKACMFAKGFSRDAVDGCVLSNQELQPACYQ